MARVAIDACERGSGSLCNWVFGAVRRSLQNKDMPRVYWEIPLVILIIALLGGFAGIGGGSFYGTGYYGGGGLGLVVVVLLVLVLLGKL